MRRIVIAVALSVLGAATLSADFSYTQTTRVTGGTLLNMSRFMPGAGQLKEPHTNTIAVKGGKMVTYDADSATIIDTDAETMTQVDFKKKQYAVITFAEMKQAMLAMRAQLAQAQAQMAQAQGQTQQAPQVNPLDAIKVSVNETGQSKVISGLNAKQFILTMEMGAPAGAPPNTPSNKTTMDTWMAPTLPGYEEVTAFGVKMASKMADMATPGNPMAMFREDVGKSVNTMAKEMSKMSGIPVQQTMTMTGMAASGPNVNVGDAAKGAATDAAVAGALGRTRLGGLAGLGGLGRKKQEEPKPAAQEPQVALQPVVLMEQVTELTSLSSTIDASKLAVPTGFKQVEHEMKKLVKQ